MAELVSEQEELTQAMVSAKDDTMFMHVLPRYMYTKLLEAAYKYLPQPAETAPKTGEVIQVWFEHGGHYGDVKYVEEHVPDSLNSLKWMYYSHSAARWYPFHKMFFLWSRIPTVRAGAHGRLLHVPSSTIPEIR